MANLIYSMMTSLDGYTEDERGAFGSRVSRAALERWRQATRHP